MNNGWINYFYIIELIVSVLLVLGLGVFLWYNCFWTSGDAKLYIAYAALIPLSVYNLGYIKYMPSIAVLINTFVPLAFIYFFKVFFRTNIKAKMIALKVIFKTKQFFNYLIFIFVVLWIPSLLVYFFNIQISFIEIMVITLLSVKFLKILLRKKILFGLIILSILRLLFDKNVYSLEFLVQFGLLFLILVIFKIFFIELGKTVFSEKIKMSNIKKGEILSDNTCKKYGIKQTGNGLTVYDIKKIKKLKLSNIRINKITPFAPYMFIGVLLTLFFRGNIIAGLFYFDYFIKNYVSKWPILTVTIALISLLTVIVYKYIQKNNKN